MKHWYEQDVLHSELPSTNLSKLYSDFDQKPLNFWLAACNSTEGEKKKKTGKYQHQNWRKSLSSLASIEDAEQKQLWF